MEWPVTGLVPDFEILIASFLILKKKLKFKMICPVNAFNKFEIKINSVIIWLDIFFMQQSNTGWCTQIILDQGFIKMLRWQNAKSFTLSTKIKNIDKLSKFWRCLVSNTFYIVDEKTI